MFVLLLLQLVAMWSFTAGRARDCATENTTAVSIANTSRNRRQGVFFCLPCNGPCGGSNGGGSLHCGSTCGCWCGTCYANPYYPSDTVGMTRWRTQWNNDFSCDYRFFYRTTAATETTFGNCSLLSTCFLGVLANATQTSDRVCVTNAPTVTPTFSPTGQPTVAAPTAPTLQPTASPTSIPTAAPTAPTSVPTGVPTASPSAHPTHAPTAQPTTQPTALPTNVPTAAPTSAPTYSLEATACFGFGETWASQNATDGPFESERLGAMWQRAAIGQMGSFRCVCSDCATGTYCQFNRRSVCNNLGTVKQPSDAFDEDVQPGTAQFSATVARMECVCENGWSGRYCDDDSELQARESSDNAQVAYIVAPIGFVLYCVTMAVNIHVARFKSYYGHVVTALLQLLAIVDLGSDIAFVLVSLHSPRFVDSIDSIDGCAARSTDNSKRLQAVGFAFLALSIIIFFIKLYRDARFIGGRDADKDRAGCLHNQLNHIFWIGLGVFIFEDIPFLALQVIYNSVVGFEISVTNLSAVVSTAITLTLHMVTFALVLHLIPKSQKDTLFKWWTDDSEAQCFPCSRIVMLMPFNDPKCTQEPDPAE